MPWREIGWSIARGCVTLAIVAYILSAIDNRYTGLIVGILGFIYARLQAMGLSLSTMLLAISHLVARRDEDEEVVQSTVGTVHDVMFLK